MNNNNRTPTKNARKDNYSWIGEGISVLQEELELTLRPDNMSISKKRYEELIKKEAMFEIINKMFDSVSGYDFRNTVGYVLGKESRE